MKNHACWLLSISTVSLLLAGSARGDWLAFRGPAHQGIAKSGDLPIEWGPRENVAWKVKLPGHGASSPIVQGERVFITCFTGTKGADIVRRLICLQRKTGKILWEQKHAAPQPENDYANQRLQHGFTTGTPIIEGERIYVNYCRGGVLCFDLNGKEIWHRELGSGRNSFGSGSSLSILGDLVLVNATVEASGLFALEKSTGKVVWKARLFGDCWSTPVVVDTDKGKEIVLNAANGLFGFDPATGKELWNCDTVGGYVSATPVIHKDVLYVIGSNFGDKATSAVRAGGRGNVTRSHVLWTNSKFGASYCSPLLIDNRLYYFSGQAVCLDRDTGKLVASRKLDGVTQLYGSPIAAQGKIYLFTRDQGAHVLSADDKLTVLAHNTLGDRSAVNASPAASGADLFIRSQEHLYCLRKNSGK